MQVIQILHMNKGAGDTSYAQNSSIQSRIISIVKPITEEAIREILSSESPPESMGIADLGCSSGPNTLKVVSEIMDVIHSHVGPSSPECRVFLNDLYSNDFNEVFAALPAFYNRLKKGKGTGSRPCFVVAVPGSFYDRLFPTRSLHFVHSSSSLHWLSQVPPGLDTENKGKIYMSQSSPARVLNSYALQFQTDFSTFLKCRSEELVPGGRMVLSFMGRTSIDATTPDGCYQWELLARALMTLVQEGMIEEHKLDSFNVPYYAPCREELNLEVQKEGSFTIDRLEAFEIEWDGGNEEIYSENFEYMLKGQRVAKIVRAVAESMIESQFGAHIMDELFRRYGELVGDYLSKTRTRYVNLVISLVRKDTDRR